jgi:hypothetical protein
VPPAVFFQDGFETGDLSRWSSATGLAVENRQAAAGRYAAEAAVAKGPAAFATESLSLPLSDVYYRVQFILNQRGANAVNLIQFQTAAGKPLVTLRINAAGKLALRNDASGFVFSGGIPVVPGAWHTLQAHVVVVGKSSRSEVWYDGLSVPALSRPLHLAADPVGRLQLGDSRRGLKYDVVFDNVVASREYVPDPLASAAGPVLAASYALLPAGSPVQSPSPYHSAIASPLPSSWPTPTP